MTAGYFFHFLDPVDMDAVAGATVELFGLPRARVLVRAWAIDRFEVVCDDAGGLPVVLIERNPPMDGDYVSFNAGEQFVAVAGDLPEVQVASRLCRSVRARAILAAEGGMSDALWVFVAPDGSSGLVVVDIDDLDEGIFTIIGAVQPIPGAPEIPLVEPPTA